MADLSRFVNELRPSFPADRLTEERGRVVLYPETAQEAADIFKLANEYKQRLYIRGSGTTRKVDDLPLSELIVVATDRLDVIHCVSAEDYYLSIGAGYRLRELNATLNERGLILPHAELPYQGTVGGAVAVGLTAVQDGQPLPIKKCFIKAQIITPEGAVIEPGSSCFKSVSGYDIVKLFAGSWGLLGLIVSATFRVLPTAFVAASRQMDMLPVDRQGLLAGLSETNPAPDAVYSRKIKDRLDPNNVLPLL